AVAVRNAVVLRFHPFGRLFLNGNDNQHLASDPCLHPISSTTIAFRFGCRTPCLSPKSRSGISSRPIRTSIQCIQTRVDGNTVAKRGRTGAKGSCLEFSGSYIN